MNYEFRVFAMFMWICNPLEQHLQLDYRAYNFYFLIINSLIKRDKFIGGPHVHNYVCEKL